MMLCERPAILSERRRRAAHPAIGGRIVYLQGHTRKFQTGKSTSHWHTQCMRDGEVGTRSRPLPSSILCAPDRSISRRLSLGFRRGEKKGGWPYARFRRLRTYCSALASNELNHGYGYVLTYFLYDG